MGGLYLPSSQEFLLPEQYGFALREISEDGRRIPVKCPVADVLSPNTLESFILGTVYSH